MGIQRSFSCFLPDAAQMWNDLIRSALTIGTSSSVSFSWGAVTKDRHNNLDDNIWPSIDCSFVQRRCRRRRGSSFYSLASRLISILVSSSPSDIIIIILLHSNEHTFRDHFNTLDLFHSPAFCSQATEIDHPANPSQRSQMSRSMLEWWSLT